METALINLKVIPKEDGEVKTSAKIADRLSRITGLIAANAEEERSIDINSCLRFYEAGLNEIGDQELRLSVIQWAKDNNRLYFKVSLGRVKEWDAYLKGYYPNSRDGYKINSLKYYDGQVPEIIVGKLALVPKKLRKHLYIAFKQKDPVLLLRIPEKNKDHRTYFCVEILRWE